MVINPQKKSAHHHTLVYYLNFPVNMVYGYPASTQISAHFSMQRFAKTTACLCLATALAAVAAVDPGDCCASVGIAGGPVFSIAISPATDQTVYLGTGTGLYTNLKGESIWTPANAGLESLSVYDVVVPVTGTARYCATGAGLYTTAAGAAQWSSLGLEDSQCFCLAVNPVTPTQLAAGTDTGVFISSDAGENWSEAPTGPELVSTLAFDPATGQTLFAGSLEKGIYKSTDLGSTWTKTTGAPARITHILPSAASPVTLFAGTSSGLYTSTDSGSTWTALNTAFSSSPVYAVVSPASLPTVLYVATDMGVYTSTDSGSNWTARNTGLQTDGTLGPYVRTIAVDPDTPATLYSATYSGSGQDADVYRSTDSGASWTQINRELSNTTVRCLAFDPEDPAIAYAGTSSLGVLKSTNGGLSWAEANEGLLTTAVRCLAINPESAPVWAGSASGLFSSSDAGVTWDASGLTYNIYCSVVDPHDPDTLLLGTDTGIYAGATDGWESLNNNIVNPFVSAIAGDPDTDGTLYVATLGDGIFKSTSAGQSWTEVNTGLDDLRVKALRVAPLDPELLFAGTAGNGLYLSTDSGLTWEQTSLNTEEGLTITCIAPKPDDPDIVYAGTDGAGFYRSIDGGFSWSVADETLIEETVYDLAIDPVNTQNVLVALDGNILLKSFNTAPDLPSKPTPADSAVNQPLTATLAWTGADADTGDTVAFSLYFGTASDPDDNAAVTLSEPAYDPGGLELAQTYYWKVSAQDSYGAETEGPVWSFSTILSNPPARPSGPSPASGAEDQALQIELSWSCSDPDEGDSLTFDVYFGPQESPFLVKQNLAETTYAVNVLRPLTTYYWKVVARDSNGIETEGLVWHFRTALIPEQCLVETVLGAQDPDTTRLRLFRDRALCRSARGRALIALYDVLSPVIASRIAENPALVRTTASVLRNLAGQLANIRVPESDVPPHVP